ncbi:MAG TPA: SGNH/GDSL hydrolase family protein [Streptosporangiaceae bacterium]|jgi:lysophospholipase L1-like esterase
MTRTAVARLLPVAAAGALLTALMPGAVSAGTGPSYVALGDSYTSGPLIPVQTGHPAGCLRSTNNYPRLAAKALGASSFTDASCQGAATQDLTHPQSVPLGTNPPQLSALKSSTTMVTLQIGGNDINFIDIVINCTTLSITNPFGSPCKKHYTSGGADQLKRAISQTAPKVAAVLKAIHQRSPHARVFVVGYPVILPNSGDGCWPLVPIAFGDVPYLRGIEQDLNQMLASQAAANKATFVNTYTDSIGHDVCQSPGKQWVEGLVPTAPAAPFHPDKAGEAAMARQVEAAAG